MPNTDAAYYGSKGDTAWMEHAACLGQDPDLFFPPPGTYPSSEHAIEICRSCPVREQCLDWAIANHQDHGIWGGLNAKQRSRIRRGPKTA